MKAEGDDGGLVEIFVKGAMFSFGALVVQMLMRRWTDREPQVVVLELAGSTPHTGISDADTEDEED
ncbi:MAG: hypothetical protein KC501_10285 [Myxococcales bacterium]|nr:hypothetical protein [Myxococcales bacterium]